uniref:Repressor of RNA polymerase III transcription MAF1 n=2 Tax=Sarcoptes scabiei TaxID=52283 RepID=A0A834RA82_SARSC
MKFLEHSHFEALNSAFNFDAGVYQISGRLESYSCKLVVSEKRLFKLWNGTDGHSPNDLETLSPPNGSFNNRMEFLSNLEQFQCNKISRKTLFYLISTLNASFNPDYDFSHCRGEEFSREPCIKDVMDSVDSTFFNTSAREEYNEIKSQLWSAIDNHINLSDCEIYRFHPNPSFDLNNEKSIWAYYYFFYSKKLKRVVFFTFCANRKDDKETDDGLAIDDSGCISFDIELM